MREMTYLGRTITGDAHTLYLALCNCRYAYSEPKIYSGRNMYGAECLAVEIESEGDADRLRDELHDMDLRVGNTRPVVDSLGKEFVAYWPWAKAQLAGMLPESANKGGGK